MTRNATAAYGAWLGWRELSRNGTPTAADFIVPDRKDLAAYAEYLLQANFADATVKHRISHLERAVALIEPHADRKHFKTVLANLGLTEFAKTSACARRRAPHSSALASS